jgi:hypothetical protein
MINQGGIEGQGDFVAKSKTLSISFKSFRINPPYQVRGRRAPDNKEVVSNNFQFRSFGFAHFVVHPEVHHE